MGNKSNTEHWAVMERMRFIERSAYWRGAVNRQDLVRVFGLSMAQASADLQQYQQENPGALVYHMNRKRYEGAEVFPLKVTEHSLEEAMGIFLNGGAAARLAGQVRALSEGNAGGVQVFVVRMPERRASQEVERKVFLAVMRRWRLRVNYYSVNSGTILWRWVQPRAFVHNGSRWHVRAWCERDGEWKDFNLSRMAEADWPVEGEVSEVPDSDMEKWNVLRLKAHRDLDDAQRKAVELDYGMVNGGVEFTVPEALENYVRKRLGLLLQDGTPARVLLESVAGE
jgi:hypothetical protein